MKKEAKICKTFPLSHFNHISKLKWLVDTRIYNTYICTHNRLPNKKGFEVQRRQYTQLLVLKQETSKWWKAAVEV